MQKQSENTHIDPNISRNFTAAKFFSILIVVLGHYSEPSYTWVIVTIGLVVFSFSSGFFTYLKYNGNFNKKKFFQKKIERLGLNLAVINAFLLIFFLIKGQPGILTWHTLINILGLGGFLNWFRIHNQSPFGDGIWYFTLLLIFYAFYPLLEYINRKKSISYIFSILFILTAFYLHHRIYYGHALWLTGCGFIAGICSARNNMKLSLILNITLFGLFTFLTVWFNYILKIKYFNFFHIFFLAMSLIFFLNHIRLSQMVINGISYFSGSILEIYLIHGYLFVRPTNYESLNFIISLAVILFTAKILSEFSSFLSKKTGI